MKVKPDLPAAGRAPYWLLAGLFLLIIPIAWTVVAGIDSLFRFIGLFAPVWLGLSGPLLLLYSLLVQQFFEGKGKALLWITALLVGLPWTAVVVYYAGQMQID